jgi:penicillin-binding protein 1A
MRLGNAQLYNKNKILDFANARNAVRARRTSQKSSPSSRFSLNKFKSSKDKSKNSKSSSKAKRILKKTGIILSLTFLFSILIGIILLIGLVSAYSKDLPNIEGYFAKSNVDGKDSVIVDRNGKELYRLQGDVIKERIKLDEVPSKLKWAFLAAEDAEFETHKGLNLAGLSRALICTIKTRGTGACGGGSSITQQLVKQTTHIEDHTLERKIKEAVLAMKVEQEYSKPYILEFYLNIVPEGGNIQGIKAGSEYHFGITDLNQLNLAQIAFLAAVPNEPSVLSPYGGSLYDSEKSQDRMHYVLNRMLELKDKTGVTAEEVYKAKEDVARLQFVRRRIDKKAPHYVDQVIKNLNTLYSDKVEEGEIGSDYLKGKGYTIVSAVDLDVQNLLQDHLKTQVDSADFQKYVGAQNASGVIINPQTGEVLAMVGSKNFDAEANPNDRRFDPEFNVATSPRSMGSNTKPFVYLAAFRKGYNPSTVLFDFPVDQRENGASQPYNITNYHGGFSQTSDPMTKRTDFITMRSALRVSLNIPAVATYHLVGREAFVDTYLKANGWEGFADQVKGPSAPIGGANIPLLEQVHAYSTLAAEGIYRPTKFILQIKNEKGEVVYDNTADQGKRTIEAKHVFLINDMNKKYWLCDGEYQYADPFIRQLNKTMDFGCKTGTSDNGRNQVADLSFMGYSTTFAMGIWAGNNCGIVECPIVNKINKDPTSDDVFKYLYKPFLQKYIDLGKLQKTKFTQPAEVKKVAICSKTGRAYDPILCPGLGGTAYYEFAADPPPAEDMIQKALVTDCGAGGVKLARQIDIDLGLAKEQFFFTYKFPNARMQQEINAKKNLSLAPVEQCNVDRTINKPQVTITSPADGIDYAKNTSLNVSALVSADLALTKVEVFLDNTLQKTFTGGPYEVSIPLSSVSVGTHTITVVATDTKGQEGRDDQMFNVKAASPTPTTSPTPTP